MYRIVRLEEKVKKLINFETHSHAAPAQLVGSISVEMECEQLAKNGCIEWRAATLCSAGAYPRDFLR